YGLGELLAVAAALVEQEAGQRVARGRRRLVVDGAVADPVQDRLRGVVGARRLADQALRQRVEPRVGAVLDDRAAEPGRDALAAGPDQRRPARAAGAVTVEAHA